MAPSPSLHRKRRLTPTRDITLRSWHPRYPTLTASGPHQSTSALTPSQPHRPMELCVSRATAFTPALATACAPPGTLDLVPRLRPLLGLSTRQPLPRGPSGLQGADQRRGCPGPVGARGRALSGPGCSPRSHRPPGASAYTGIGAGQASVAALVSPRDPAPSGGQEHYTAQEAFTLDGGPAPLHTCHVWVPRLTRPTGAQHCTQLVGRTRA